MSKKERPPSYSSIYPPSIKNYNTMDDGTRDTMDDMDTPKKTVDLESGQRSSNGITNRYTQGIDNMGTNCCGAMPFCGEDSDHFVSDKKRLMRRVYSALTVQILITSLIVYFFISNATALTLLVSVSTIVIWSMFAVAIVVLIMLLCCNLQKSYPLNLVLLGIFTVAEALTVSVACSSLVCQVDTEMGVCMIDHGMQGVVAQAFTITLVVFIGLTIFELQTKINFNWLGGILTIGLFILIVWGIFIAIFGWFDNMIYSLFGIIIFIGYILFDTWRLIDQFEPDDWIIMTIQLYLDILNLFLYILRFLNELNKNND